MRGPQTIHPHAQCKTCAGPMDNRRGKEGLLFLLVDSSLQVFGLNANNNSSGTLYNSALQNLLGDRSPTGQDGEGSVFRAGDLKMINDFSQGELCPPPPTCCVLPPSFASLFAGGAGGGPLKEKLTIAESSARGEPCAGKAGMLSCYNFSFIFLKINI